MSAPIPLEDYLYDIISLGETTCWIRNVSFVGGENRFLGPPGKALGEPPGFDHLRGDFNGFLMIVWNRKGTYAPQNSSEMGGCVYLCTLRHVWF